MLHVVNDREFMVLVLGKTEVVNARRDYAIPVNMALSSYWVSHLDPYSSLLLFWLNSRTLSMGKAADQIATKEFTTPHPDNISAVLPLSETTIRKNLKLLCDEDLIHVYSARSLEKGSETIARLFEINCKLVFERAKLSPKTRDLLIKTDHKVALEAQYKGGSPFTPPLVNREGVYMYKSIESSELDKSSLMSAGSALPNVAEVSSDRTSNVATLPTPKKPRSIYASSESATEILARVKTTSVVRGEGRAAAAGQSLTVQNLQALLDLNMRRYCPELPRMIVTQKPFGVLRKRVQQAQVDVTKFMEFTIREWSTLAEQNRAAFIRDPARARTSQPLPAAPTFTTLAYRLPYFLAAYANNFTPTKEADKQSGLEKQVQTLKDKLRDATRETAVARDILRRTRTKASTTAAPAPIPQPRVMGKTMDAGLLDDWTPPAWDDEEDNKPARRVQRGK